MSSKRKDYSNAAFLYVNEPPDITDHPDDVSKNEGESATFYVTSTGSAPLYYQWQVDEGSGFGNIEGETRSSYTIPAVASIEDQNLYRCVVSNMCAATNSTAAKLTVIVPEYNDGWFKQTTIYSYDFIDVVPVSERMPIPFGCAQTILPLPCCFFIKPSFTS